MLNRYFASLSALWNLVRYPPGLWLLIIIGLLFLVAAVLPYQHYLLPENEIESVATSSNLTVQAVLMKRAEPQRLRIPDISVDTSFTAPLGLELNGEVMVPERYDDVGWYKFGPTPGELGPSVILGHVDSVNGPAVFWSLGQLEEGDDIYVDREDGTTAHFKVTELRRVPQTDFPTRAVYGDIDHAGLRLITCTGVFSQGEQRYSHNLIVFARSV